MNPARFFATTAFAQEASDEKAQAASRSQPTQEELTSRQSETVGKTLSVFRDNPLASLTEALREKERQLAEKEKELQDAQAQLEALRKELEQVLNQTDAKLREMERLAGDADTQRKRELSKWVKIYEGMKPDGTAKIFEGLDAQFALELLVQMEPKKASKILEAMIQTNSRKAVELSKLLEESRL